MKIDKELIDKILGKSLKKGAAKAELFAISSKAVAAEAKNQDIEALDRANSSGFSLRIQKGKRPGFGYSTDINDWQRVVDVAIESSQWTEEDAFLDFPDSNHYPSVEIYDEEIARANEDDAVGMASAMEKAALSEDGRVKKVRKATISLVASDIYLANTHGLYGNFKATSVNAHVAVVAEESGESQMGWEFEGSRSLSDISPERVGKGASRRALSLIGSKIVKSLKAPVILDHLIANEFLRLLASALSSENVQKGKSLLMNKKGKKIISERLNIIDIGLLAHGLGSRPFDAEGVPSQRTELISEGVLRGFLYNTYTAAKEGLRSTGNAVRGGISGFLGVGISNLVVETASSEYVRSVDEMVSSIDRGLLVTEAMGVHTANPVSGEFSVGINGLWIERGKVVYPVKEAVISGNILDLFKNVEAVGNDRKFYGKIGSPSLLISSVDISA